MGDTSKRIVAEQPSNRRIVCAEDADQARPRDGLDIGLAARAPAVDNGSLARRRKLPRCSALPPNRRVIHDASSVPCAIL
jgi:hypothetical protein